MRFPNPDAAMWIVAGAAFIMALYAALYCAYSVWVIFHIAAILRGG